MNLKLYAMPGSHPCLAVEAVLEAKGLRYDRVDLLPGVSPLHQLAAFGKRTVPAMKIDGDKVVGSRVIMRRLDELAPEPPLYPEGEPQRAAVTAADAWGDEELQETARWTAVYALSQRPEAAASFLAGSNAPRLPDALLAPVTRAVFGAELRVLGSGPAGTERALRALPGQLDHADELIAEGTIGGDPPNAAAYQVAASVRLLLAVADLHDAIAARPCGRLAERLFPRFPGEIPAGALPREWLPELGAGTPEPAR